MDALVESLLKCKVNGNIVSLPPMSDGPLLNYVDVRKALINAGGKYKNNTFVFPADAQPYMDRLTGGESVNIKKEFQFFGTPDELCERMVDLAEINQDHLILEPSAGQGAIIKAVQNLIPFKQVMWCELMDENRNVTVKLQNIQTFIQQDFLKISQNPVYDRIIANPPFTKNQDIDHILKMYEVLKPGGKIVTIASMSWTFGSQKKQIAFREWLDEVGAYQEELPLGTFKESGTNVKAMLLVIDKAA